MSIPSAAPTISGPAYRVTILGLEPPESYENVFARIDAEHRVAHVFSADGQTHFLTIPLSSTLIEWRDPAVLEAGPRLPAFNARAFDRMGEQVQRMAEGFSRGFGSPPRPDR